MDIIKLNICIILVSSMHLSTCRGFRSGMFDYKPSIPKYSSFDSIPSLPNIKVPYRSPSIHYSNSINVDDSITSAQESRNEEDADPLSEWIFRSNLYLGLFIASFILAAFLTIGICIARCRKYDATKNEGIFPVDFRVVFSGILEMQCIGNNNYF